MDEKEGYPRTNPVYTTPIALVTMLDPREEFYINFQRVKGMDLKEQNLSTHRSLGELLAGEDLVDLGVVERKADLHRAVDRIGGSGCAGVIIDVPGWTPPGWGGVLYARTGLPILVHAPFALSGPMAMRGELETLGADYEISLGEGEMVAEFIRRVKAKRLLSLLRGKRFGSVGGLGMDMHYAEIASSSALLDFGVEIIYIDGAGVLKRSEGVAPGRLDGFLSRLQGVEGGLPDDATGVLRRQVSYYLALKDVLEEEEVDFLSVKCQPEFSDLYGCLCFAPTFLPLSRDLEGEKRMMPVSCEGDFFASMAGYLLLLLSGRPPLFADFIIPLYEENLLALQNCGGAPAWYAGGGEDPAENIRRIRLARNVQGASGSFCVDYLAVEMGPVTVLGMGKRRTSYWVGSARGEIKPRQDLKPLLMDWPTFFLEVDDARECLRSFFSQHVTLVPGDHVSVLQELKKLVEGR